MSKFIQQAGHALACFLLFTSGLVLLSLMGLTVVEVFSRYLLNAPIDGKQDIAKMLLACCLFLAMPVMTLRREHIDVDLLDGFFSGTARFVRDRMIDVIVGGGLLIMSWWLWDRAAKFFKRGTASEALFIPVYPVTYFIAFMVAISGAALLILALARCYDAIQKKKVCD